MGDINEMTALASSSSSEMRQRKNSQVQSQQQNVEDNNNTTKKNQSFGVQQQVFIPTFQYGIDSYVTFLIGLGLVVLSTVYGTLYYILLPNRTGGDDNPTSFIGSIYFPAPASEYCTTNSNTTTTTTNPCTRSDLFAFQITSSIPILLCAMIGFITWHLNYWFQSAPKTITTTTTISGIRHPLFTTSYGRLLLGGSIKMITETTSSSQPGTTGIRNNNNHKNDPKGEKQQLQQLNESSTGSILFTQSILSAGEYIAIINFTFQLWDFIISLCFIPEHNTTIMLCHHCMACIVSYCSLHYKVLYYYGIYFLGCTEISSIFLVWCDMAKFFPPKMNTFYHQLVFQYCGPCFVITFFIYRIVLWWQMSIQLYYDVYNVLYNKTMNHTNIIMEQMNSCSNSNTVQVSSSSFVVLLNQRKKDCTWVFFIFLFCNIPLGILQIYWFMIVLKEARQHLL